MSFANQECPCGGRKEADTMLCEECAEELADYPDMLALQDQELGWSYRRAAAIRMLALARRRRRQGVNVGGVA